MRDAHVYFSYLFFLCRKILLTITPSRRTLPRIYVACLSSYNAGRLHGRWIDCDQTAEEIREEIRLMLEESPEPWAEEWAIHDYEGFGGLRASRA